MLPRKRTHRARSDEIESGIFLDTIGAIGAALADNLAESASLGIDRSSSSPARPRTRPEDARDRSATPETLRLLLEGLDIGPERPERLPLGLGQLRQRRIVADAGQ